MTNPLEVHSEMWAEQPLVLFDNGTYSVVSGVLKGEHSQPRLVQRWNTMAGRLTPDFGFPIDEGKKPDWLLVPEFLEVPILHALIDELSENPGIQNLRVRLDLIFKELKRCRTAKAVNP
jgi:hypothetical protein